jgi:hypothetical protein
MLAEYQNPDAIGLSAQGKNPGPGLENNRRTNIEEIKDENTLTLSSKRSGKRLERF